MSTTNYNKIISTINSVSSNYSYIPDPNNLICIDSSNNRIGINTLNPSQSIDVSGGTIRANNFMINDISLNRNIDKKSIIKNLINYILRNTALIGDNKFLNMVENLLHSEIYSDNLYVDYFYLWDIVSSGILFSDKKNSHTNLIILRNNEDDITKNVSIVCPSSSHSNFRYLRYSSSCYRGYG